MTIRLDGCSALIIVFLGAIGWAMNIATIIAQFSSPITAALLTRMIGVPVFPIGCIMGWF